MDPATPGWQAVLASTLVLFLLVRVLQVVVDTQILGRGLPQNRNCAGLHLRSTRPRLALGQGCSPPWSGCRGAPLKQTLRELHVT